jgi:hypothetical protein
MLLSSASLLWRWFTGSIGSEEKRPQSAERLLAFTLLAVFFFGAVWLGFQQIRPLYGGILASGAEFYFALEGKNFRFALSGPDILFRCYEPPSFEATIESSGLYANIVLLSALLLATPGMRWRKRWLALGLGLALLSLSHIAFLIIKVETTLIETRHPLAGIESLWKFWDDFFEIMGKEFFPILIWLCLGMRYMLGASDRPVLRSVGPAVGRNMPCPCGSGRKYKVCCGPQGGVN